MVQQDSKQNGKQKKGKQIIVTGGKYQGEKGWIDESQGEKGYTKKQVYIIFVDDDENEVTKRVSQRSIEASLRMELRSRNLYAGSIGSAHTDIMQNKGTFPIACIPGA
jgi:hypothetical protein